MTSKDKVIMYLLDDTCVDTCTKCIYDGWWKDESCKGCPEQNKHGDKACLQGMTKWFERYGKTFGDFIKEKRIELGLSRREFGNELGVTKLTVFCWENNKNYPKPFNLMCLADLLHCSVSELLERK